ncbi:MAG: substrate-binding domain-containing protein [Gammaproteobacteria bacterium]
MTPGRARMCARLFLSCLLWCIPGALLTVAGSHGAEKAPVRLAVVNTPEQSGLLADLLPRFEAESGYAVEIYSGSDVFRRAELGKADLIICHYGKAPVEDFVTSGKGLWPRPVFSNQLVLVGPAEDPAGIRGMSDPFAAMARIAVSGAAFVSSSSPGARYMSEMLVAGAGVEKGLWYIETRQSKGRAVRFSEEKNAYTVWGAFPFERFRGKHDTDMEVMVWNSPILHRLMASIVVNPEHFPGANREAATALQGYLLSPAVQARVAAFREEGIDRPTWWPAARNNDPRWMLSQAAAD